MKEVKVKNVVCRLCMDLSTEFTNIFQENKINGCAAATVIKDLLQLEATESDSYPNAVCNICLKQLNKFRDFKLKCLVTKEKFDKQITTGHYIRFPPKKSDQPPDIAESNNAINKEPSSHLLSILSQPVVGVADENDQWNTQLQKLLAPRQSHPEPEIEMITLEDDSIPIIESETPQNQDISPKQKGVEAIVLPPAVQRTKVKRNRLRDDDRASSGTLSARKKEKLLQKSHSEASTSQARLPEKVFEVTDRCCSMVCHSMVNLEEQERIKTSFRNDTIEKQDAYVISCLEMDNLKDKLGKKSKCYWSYRIRARGKVHSVCKSFFLGLFNLTEDRLRKLKKKFKFLRTSFKKVDSCCCKKCYRTVRSDKQQEIHRKFWEYDSTEKQDSFLSRFMEHKKTKMAEEGVDDDQEGLNWSYYLTFACKIYPICESFIKNLFQIGDERLKIIQENIQVQKRTFMLVDECCVKMCYRNVTSETQETLYKSFWEMDSDETRDLFLLNSMDMMNLKQDDERIIFYTGECYWAYWVQLKGKNVNVCRTFLMSLYQIADERIKSLQQKIKAKKKIFKKLDKCCFRMCYSILPLEKQKIFYKMFWEIVDKKRQDEFLSKCLENKNLRPVDDGTLKNQECSWIYSITLGGSKYYRMCKAAILNLLLIEEERFMAIQHRIQFFKSVDECCPKYCYSFLSLDKQWELFMPYSKMKDLEKQEEFLSKFLEKKTLVIPTTPQGNVVYNGMRRWMYSVILSGKNYYVCKTFLQKLFNVEPARFHTLEKKMQMQKVFRKMDKCCLRMCYSFISSEKQRDFYHMFLKIDGTDEQDRFLANCIERRKLKDLKNQEEVGLQTSSNSCLYFSMDETYRVCKSFVKKLLDLDEERLTKILEIAEEHPPNKVMRLNNSISSSDGIELTEQVIPKASTSETPASEISQQIERVCSVDSNSITEELNTVQPMSQCCNKICSSKISSEQKKKLLQEFNELENNHARDIYLIKCMKKRKQESNLIQKREYVWEYSVTSDGKVYRVCQSFLQNVLQIKEEKIKLLQRRMKKPPIKFIGPAYKKVMVGGKIFYEKIPIRSPKEVSSLQENNKQPTEKNTPENENSSKDFGELTTGDDLDESEDLVRMKQDKNIDDYDAWGNLITKTPVKKLSSEDATSTSQLLSINDDSVQIIDDENGVASQIPSVCSSPKQIKITNSDPESAKDDLVNIRYFENISSQMKLLFGTTNEEEFITDDYHPKDAAKIKEEVDHDSLKKECKKKYPGSEDVGPDEVVTGIGGIIIHRDMNLHKICNKSSTLYSKNMKQAEGFSGGEKSTEQVADTSEGRFSERSYPDSVTEQTEKPLPILVESKRCISRSSTDKEDSDVKISEEMFEGTCSEHKSLEGGGGGNKSLDMSDGIEEAGDISPVTCGGDKESGVDKRWSMSVPSAQRFMPTSSLPMPIPTSIPKLTISSATSAGRPSPLSVPFTPRRGDTQEGNLFSETSVLKYLLQNRS